MADFNQTGTLEVFQSLYSKYSLKLSQFSYPVMIASAYLAVLYFNSKVGLAHPKNKQGDLQYKQSWVVKKIYENKEKETYKNHIMHDIKHLQMTSTRYKMSILANAPKYVGGIAKPEKAQTIST